MVPDRGHPRPLLCARRTWWVSENPTWHSDSKHLEPIIQELAQAGHLSKLRSFQRNSERGMFMNTVSPDEYPRFPQGVFWGHRLSEVSTHCLSLSEMCLTSRKGTVSVILCRLVTLKRVRASSPFPSSLTMASPQALRASKRASLSKMNLMDPFQRCGCVFTSERL